MWCSNSRYHRALSKMKLKNKIKHWKKKNKKIKEIESFRIWSDRIQKKSVILFIVGLLQLHDSNLLRKFLFSRRFLSFALSPLQFPLFDLFRFIQLNKNSYCFCHTHRMDFYGIAPTIKNHFNLNDSSAFSTPPQWVAAKQYR